jgi:hypothetical protein
MHPSYFAATTTHRQTASIVTLLSLSNVIHSPVNSKQNKTPLGMNNHRERIIAGDAPRSDVQLRSERDTDGCCEQLRMTDCFY